MNNQYENSGYISIPKIQPAGEKTVETKRIMKVKEIQVQNYAEDAHKQHENLKFARLYWKICVPNNEPSNKISNKSFENIAKK